MTTALLVPASPAGITSAEAHPEPTALTPHPFFAARRELEDRLGDWLDSLDVDRLCALSALCDARMSDRFGSQLLESARWEAVLAVAIGECESRSPVTSVQFGTSTWDNGIFYTESSADFVHADGTVSVVDCGDKVAEHLVDLSSVEHPENCDTLTVDLVSGCITT